MDKQFKSRSQASNVTQRIFKEINASPHRSSVPDLHQVRFPAPFEPIPRLETSLNSPQPDSCPRAEDQGTSAALRPVISSQFSNDLPLEGIIQCGFRVIYQTCPNLLQSPNSLSALVQECLTQTEVLEEAESLALSRVPINEATIFAEIVRTVSFSGIYTASTIRQELSLLHYTWSNPRLKPYFDMNPEGDETFPEQFGSVELTLKSALLTQSPKTTILRELIETLMHFYAENLRFREFPGPHILFRPRGWVFRTFCLAELIDSTCSVSESSYKLKMRRGFSKFLASVNRSNFAFMSQYDFVDPSELAFPIENREPLGRGGYGVVYSNILNGHPVAIKLPLARNESVREASRCIQREYQCLKALKHPNILRVLGLVKYQESYGLVTELCTLSLTKYYMSKRANNTYDLAETMKDLLQAAEALEFVHTRGFSHFDIKPSNFFRNHNDQVVLADFGLARYTDCEDGVKPSGYTLLYASPEQLRSKPESFNKGSDVWSFGVTMLTLLTGEKPYGEMPLTKSQLRKEICTNKRTPIVPAVFEQAYPELAHLMKLCWLPLPERIAMQYIRHSLNEFVNKPET